MMRRFLSRFRKPEPTPDIATLACEPGKSMIRLVRGDTVVAVLVLEQVEFNYNRPTTAQFVDLTALMAERNTKQVEPDSEG